MEGRNRIEKKPIEKEFEYSDVSRSRYSLFKALWIYIFVKFNWI